MLRPPPLRNVALRTPDLSIEFKHQGEPKGSPFCFRLITFRGEPGNAGNPG